MTRKGVLPELLADHAVDRLAQQVGVPGVPRGLLDQVQHHPAERERLAADARRGRDVVQAGRPRRHLPGAVARVPVPAAQPVGLLLERGAELVIGIGLPVDAREVLAGLVAEELLLEPVLLDERQVVQDAGECQAGAGDLLRELRLRQPVGLEQDRLPLVVEVLLERIPLAGRRGVRVLPHRRLLSVAHRDFKPQKRTADLSQGQLHSQRRYSSVSWPQS
jgi:hypothetical protein